MKLSLKAIRQRGFEKVAERDGIVEYVFKRNGLKVLHVENHSVPVVTTLIVYKIGSRNEAVGYTGSTHFLEHMMFKGTDTRNPQSGTGVTDILAPMGALQCHDRHGPDQLLRDRSPRQPPRPPCHGSRPHAQSAFAQGRP